MMDCNDLGYAFQEQLAVLPAEGMLTHWAGLTGFQQTELGVEILLKEVRSSRVVRTDDELETVRRDDPEAEFVWDTCIRYVGEYEESDEDRICPRCGAAMVPRGSQTTILKHSTNGLQKAEIHVKRRRLQCTHCGHRPTVTLPFQAGHHRITCQLEQDIEQLCRLGLTHSHIHRLTGVHRHIIKAIDKRRLEEEYKNGGTLKKPDRQARFLGIDEFSLHSGHQYATQIMDMETGHVLFLAKGKKKDVVYQFIDHVGLRWMAGVKAVCCDMNAGFANAFRERCPHLEIVYDRFHLVQNFNEMVLTEVRKDVQKELLKNGDVDGAKLLKRSKYIILSSRATREENDRKAEERRTLRAEEGEAASGVRKKGQVERHDEIIALNELFFIADYVKESLSAAYQQTDRSVMEADIREIIAVCRETRNEHFIRFAGLLERHIDGITAHALYPRNSGRIEGMNNKIKTLRRRSYGMSDTEFFFLKIMDASRRRTA